MPRYCTSGPGTLRPGTLRPGTLRPGTLMNPHQEAHARLR